VKKKQWLVPAKSYNTERKGEKMRKDTEGKKKMSPPTAHSNRCSYVGSTHKNKVNKEEKTQNKCV
jgi:hypothetical protein